MDELENELYKVYGDFGVLEVYARNPIEAAKNAAMVINDKNQFVGYVLNFSVMDMSGIESYLSVEIEPTTSYIVHPTKSNRGGQHIATAR